MADDSAAATHDRYQSFQAWLDGARDDSQSSAMDKAEALRIVQIAAKNHGGLGCDRSPAWHDWHHPCPSDSTLYLRASEMEQYLAQMQVEDKIMVDGDQIYWV